MWHVAYAARAEHQGQAVGFIPRDTLPSDEQCRALFDAFVELGLPTWALAMRLAHRSGVRWGELIALRPVDIDFEPHRIVRVHRAVEQSTTGGRVFKTPKNAQQRTTIFPASLAEDLAARVEQSGGSVATKRCCSPTTLVSLPSAASSFDLWHRSARRAGWPMRTNKNALWHPHDLRHVAACWMLFDVGIDPAVAARMLGHANAAFTLSRYVGVRTGADAATNTLTDRW